MQDTTLDQTTTNGDGKQTAERYGLWEWGEKKGEKENKLDMKIVTEIADRKINGYKKKF